MDVLSSFFHLYVLCRLKKLRQQAEFPGVLTSGVSALGDLKLGF